MVTEYLLNGSDIVMQKSGSDVLWFYGGGFDLNGTRYLYVKNAQGDITGITDAAGNLVVEYIYDSWGKLLETTGSLAKTVGMKNPFRYRGYYYDIESGLYYVQSRYYDPVTGRFLNADGAVGVNEDMATYNLFVYCGNNPINRYDAGGLFWEELISGVIYAGNNFVVAIGIDTAAIGAFFLMMEQDNSGVYHADFDCWQQYFGYNDLYDKVFDLGTSMKAAKFDFVYNGTDYIIWAWKGDYINLGAGAELGIYYGGEPHWLVDKSLAMPMCMGLMCDGEYIIWHNPSEKQWWITGFNPYYPNIDVSRLTATFAISFNSRGMFEAFYDKWKKDPRWRFTPWECGALLTF